MDFRALLDSIWGSLGTVLPRALYALAILVIGWLVAVVVRAGVRRSLKFLRVNDRVRKGSEVKMDVVGGIGAGVYYLVLLMTLIGFFAALQLELVTGPLQQLAGRIFAFGPNLIAGVVLILAAWLAATMVRRLVTAALSRTSIDERIAAEADVAPPSKTLGHVLYWIVLLLFLPVILGTLGLTGLLGPIQLMLEKALGMVPNVFAAAIIGAVGWFVAKSLRDIVSNILAVTRLDQLGLRAGLRDGVSLSRLIGLVVYVFVLVPAAIASLNALKVEAISAPAVEMLGAFMAAIPKIFAAAIIIGISFIVARLVSGLVATLLEGAGFDNLLARLGVNVETSEASRPSQVAGKAVFFFAMLFAAVEASSMLGFEQVAGIVSSLITFGGQLLLGAVVIAVGFWLSGVARSALVKVHVDSAIAGIVRMAIIGLVFAMGLRAMGIADDIVNLTFALTLGAVAVAVALAFGLGGRDAAGRQLDHWFRKLRGASPSVAAEAAAARAIPQPAAQKRAPQ